MNTITYDFLDTSKLYHKDQEVSFEDRDAANAAWRQLKELEKKGLVFNIRTNCKMYNIVKVKFGSSKLYTYLTDTEVKVGTLVVVSTYEGLTVVSVVESGKATKAELEKVCPFDQYVHIKGKVVPA